MGGGTAQFKISGQADWGCSSLNTFSDDLEKTWPGRTDFHITDEITVPVTRLDAFVEEHGIAEIEYLHVDVQGSDLEVLMGLGKHVRIVKAGVIEMARDHDVKLYKEQKYTIKDARKFLDDNGFRIIAETPNDVFCNAYNVHFTRIL